MCSGFRRWGPAFGRQLAERKRRVSEAQLGDLAKAGRQGPETAFALEPADGLELRVRCPAGALEVGVIGVREPVRLRARGRDDRVLLERERRVARSGKGKRLGDRIGALEIGRPETTALAQMEVDSLLARDPRQKLAAVMVRRPELELPRPRAAHRAAAEQRASHVRAAAAPPPGKALRRPGEWRATRRQHSCLLEDGECRRGTRDVELVPGGTREGMLGIRPDLGLDAEVAKQGESAPRDGRRSEIEVERNLAVAAEMQAAGGV